MPFASSTRRTVFDRATIALFLAALLAPTADLFLRPDAPRNTLREGRAPAPRPSLAMDPDVLARFPERCDAWFNDTFGLRDRLVRWNSIEKIELLQVSPSPKTIVLGEDDWMIYSEGKTMRVWRGLDPLSPAELEAWKDALEANRDRLAARGIGYLFVIGPNKETIYPEKVPSRFNRVGPTRFDQLTEYLAARSTFRILDLRPALLAAKREDVRGDELYLRDGTHWNARGAAVAYREIVGALAAWQPGLAPLPLDRFATRSTPIDDSWRYRMSVDDRNPQGARTWYAPRPESAPVLGWGPEGSGRVRVTELPADGPPRVLLLHDSFASAPAPLLEETVGHLAMHWTHRFTTNDLEIERPNVVVHLLVERALVAVRPTDLELREVPTDRELYEASTDSIYRLDERTVTPWGDAKVAPSADGGVDADFPEWKSLAVLPELLLAGGAVLSADVTAPARTSLLVFYKQDPSAPYAERQSIGVQLEAGRSRVFLRLPEGVRGGLGIRTGSNPGRISIHALEIRRSPRD